MRTLLLVVLLLTAAVGRAEEVVIAHARVKSEGADPKWAKATADTIAAARTVYLEEFGCDMPETVRGELTVKAGATTRLYTDGNAGLFLFVPSEAKLARPARSGVFNLYGMCHELGHMAMYRVLMDRDWMTSAAAEGWAHYAGSVVTDSVYKLKGESLWPDRYDYRADGTARLEKQLAGKPDQVTRGAGAWQDLEDIIGRKGFAKLFVGWQAAEIDPAKPAESLLAAIVRLFPDQKDALATWWETAGPLFVKQAGPASDVKVVTIAASQLTGKPVTLAGDDGTADGKHSFAGGGHGRKFSVPDEGEWYVRAVSVCGSQYGRTQGAMFDLALCDAELKPISVWKKSYAAFKNADPQWVRLPVTPTRVPKDFVICLNFRPTATKGVYVAYDSSTKGHSTVGVPGESGSPFKNGDWMIRVEIDRPASAASRAAP